MDTTYSNAFQNFGGATFPSIEGQPAYPSFGANDSQGFQQPPFLLFPKTEQTSTPFEVESEDAMIAKAVQELAVFPFYLFT